MEKKESSIIIYTTEDGGLNLQMKMENETVWLTQSQMAELFGRDRTIIASTSTMFQGRGTRPEYHMCKICTHGQGRESNL